MVTNRSTLLCSTSLLVLLAASLISPLITVSNSSNAPYVFYLYAATTCPFCRALKEFVISTFGEEHLIVVYVDTDENAVRRYADMWSNYLKPYGVDPVVPITLVLSDGEVKAVVIGLVRDPEFWSSLTELEAGNDIPLYEATKLLGIIKVDSNLKFLMKYAPEYYELIASGNPVTTETSAGGGTEEGSSAPLGPGELIPTLVVLALSDSINPCVMYIYTALLLGAVIASGVSASGVRKRRSRRVKLGRRVALTGTAFILAVFTGYFILGLGLVSVFRYLPTVVLSAVALGFGIWVIYSALARRYCPPDGSRECKEGRFDRILIHRLLSRAEASIPTAFLLGLLLSFTLLPCSAGPYIVFTGLVSKLGLLNSLGLLVLYNAVFITPLAVILGIVVKTSEVRGVREFVSKYGNYLLLIAGGVLIAIGFYTLFYY